MLESESSIPSSSLPPHGVSPTWGALGRELCPCLLPAGLLLLRSCPTQTRRGSLDSAAAFSSSGLALNNHFIPKGFCSSVEQPRICLPAPGSDTAAEGVPGPSSPTANRASRSCSLIPLSKGSQCHRQPHSGEHLPLLQLTADLPSPDLNSTCFPQFLLFQNLVQSYANLMSKINSPTFPETARWERGFRGYQPSGESCPFLVGFVVEMQRNCTSSPNAP